MTTLSSESARVTAPTMVTGSGKGRSARQSWGFTKGPHSHWAEPNTSIDLCSMHVQLAPECWRPPP
jgi:hypothetical protein